MAAPFQGLFDPKGCDATGKPQPRVEDWRPSERTAVAPDASSAKDHRPGKVSHDGQVPSLVELAPGQAPGEVLRWEHGRQRVPGDDAATSATGLYRMNEEALLRLEKGLSSQREQQRLPHRSVLAAPGICPDGDGEAAVEPDQVSLQPRSQIGTADIRHADQRLNGSGPNIIAERERHVLTAAISQASSSLPEGARSSPPGRSRLTLFMCALAIAIGGADLSYQLWSWASRSSDRASVNLQTGQPAGVPQAAEVPIPRSFQPPQASDTPPASEAAKDANTSGKPIVSDERSPKIGLEPPSSVSNAQSVETGGVAEPAVSDPHTLTPSPGEIKKSRANPQGRHSRNPRHNVAIRPLGSNPIAGTQDKATKGGQ